MISRLTFVSAALATAACGASYLAATQAIDDSNVSFFFEALAVILFLSFIATGASAIANALLHATMYDQKAIEERNRLEVMRTKLIAANDNEGGE